MEERGDHRECLQEVVAAQEEGDQCKRRIEIEIGGDRETEGAAEEMAEEDLHLLPLRERKAAEVHLQLKRREEERGEAGEAHPHRPRVNGARGGARGAREEREVGKEVGKEVAGEIEEVDILLRERGEIEEVGVRPSLLRAREATGVVPLLRKREEVAGPRSHPRVREEEEVMGAEAGRRMETKGEEERRAGSPRTYSRGKGTRGDAWMSIGIRRGEELRGSISQGDRLTKFHCNVLVVINDFLLLLLFIKGQEKVGACHS